jgi:3-oxoacyl-[acyl-carrier-protein] synthase-3
MTGIGILGTGRALAAEIETNDELSRRLSTTGEALLTKTGIAQRRVAGPDETTSGLALRAAREALDRAGLAPAAIGLVIVCTFSGDHAFPAVSAKVAGQLGITEAQSFDLQANCAGFVNGLVIAADRLRCDPALGHALVVGAELHTQFVDRDDPETAPSFADGAGAAVLGPVEAGAGLLASAFHTDASNWEAVRLRRGAQIEQNNVASGRQTMTHLPPTIRRACTTAGVAIEDVDRFILHQANLPMIQYVVRKLRAPLDRAYVNLEQIGNTGAASVAIALNDAIEDQAVRAGDTVVLAAAGAGFLFAASVWRWA